jgi:hypothetical protein
VLVAQLTLLAPSFNWRALSVSSHASLPPIPHLARRYLHATLALIAVVALMGPLRRSTQIAPNPAPAHARARILNAGIWAVHFGIDNAGRDSQRSMRDLFRDMDLDVVGLLETDLHVSQGPLYIALPVLTSSVHQATCIWKQRPVGESTVIWTAFIPELPISGLEWLWKIWVMYVPMARVSPLLVLLIGDIVRGHWTWTQQAHLGLRTLVEGPCLASDGLFLLTIAVHSSLSSDPGTTYYLHQTGSLRQLLKL